MLDVLGVMLKHLNIVRYMASAVEYQIKRALFINFHVLNQIELYTHIMTVILMNILTDIFVFMTMRFLTIIYKNGTWKRCYQINQNMRQES